MKVSDYVPILYEKNTEMKALIDAEEYELENNIKVQLTNAFKDNFPILATRNGIENYEKLLGIQLDPNNTDLEYRRNKIITVLTTNFPLTYRWLINSLNYYLGEGNYEIKLDAANYDLLIKCSNVFDDTVTTLYYLYRPLIPANLTFRIAVAEQVDGQMTTGGIIHQGDKIKVEGEVDN